MGKTLPQTILVPGDVLLYRGRSWMSRAIRLFDGTSVSHAGLYLETGTVAEATGDGVIRRPLATSVSTAEHVLVRRMEPAPRSMKPVQARARVIVAEGHRYAYEQIILLAFLCLSRRLVPTGSLGRFVRTVLDTAAARVAGWFAGNVEPMICSEFVFRAYDEADPDPRDVFTLEIVPLTRNERFASTPRSRAPGQPAVAGRGRGIHRGSILAHVPSAPARRPPARRPSSASGPRLRPASDEEMRKLFEAHVRERRGATAASGAMRIDSELQRAVERFAMAWAGPEVEGAAPRRAPMENLFAVASDFVTPGDLLRTKSLRTRGPLELRAPGRRPRTPGGRKRRRGPDGKIWSLSQVELESIDIVARLTPGVDRNAISSATRFGRDLGWDEWYLLRLRAPLRERFHVNLSAVRVKDLEQVGDLVEALWAEMEDP